MLFEDILGRLWTEWANYVGSILLANPCQTLRLRLLLDLYICIRDGLISCALTCAFCASIERRAVGHIAAAGLHRNERTDRQLIMMMSLDAVLYTDDHETASEIGENCELV